MSRRSFSSYSWADVVNFVKFHISTQYRTINHKKRLDQTVGFDTALAIVKKKYLASGHTNMYQNKLASLIANVLANKKNTNIKAFVFKVKR